MCLCLFKNLFVASLYHTTPAEGQLRLWMRIRSWQPSVHPVLMNTFLSLSSLPTPLGRSSGQRVSSEHRDAPFSALCARSPNNQTFGAVKGLRTLGGHWRTGRLCWKHQSSSRFFDNQILFQVDLPVSVNLLVGFRRDEGSWVQVPVQVKLAPWPLSLGGVGDSTVTHPRLMRGMKWTGEQ